MGRAGARLHRTLSALWEFWQKANNDWIFNLAAMLAYNFLVSIIPVGLLLLAIAGFFVGDIRPGGATGLQHGIASVFPNQLGVPLINAVAQHLRSSAPIFFILGIGTSLFTGSGLFVAMENCFGIVFRLRGRDLVHLNVMAISMLLLYIVLVPLLFLGSIVPAAILRAVDYGGHAAFRNFLIQAAGVGVSLVVAFVLFFSIYTIVPNMRVQWKEALRASLVAALLLVLYDVLFPIYVSMLLHPHNYGSVAGFLLVIVLFFYYLSFILLMGAEIMSWDAGQRRTLSDVSGIMHEVQAHNTLLGAAGRTAGLPREDLQHHKGAAAMRDRQAAREHESQDHRDDAPPREVTRDD
jgi:membrane protein